MFANKNVISVDFDNNNSLVLLDPKKSYDVAYINHETIIMFGKAAKVKVLFRVIDEGKYYGVNIECWYNVNKLVGKTGKNGNFRAGSRSKLIRDYAKCFGLPPRLDRISLSKFKNHIVQTKVRTVTKDSRQSPIPSPLHYSVVDEILGATQL